MGVKLLLRVLADIFAGVGNGAGRLRDGEGTEGRMGVMGWWLGSVRSRDGVRSRERGAGLLVVLVGGICAVRRSGAVGWDEEAAVRSVWLGAGGWEGGGGLMASARALLESEDWKRKSHTDGGHNAAWSASLAKRVA